MHDFSVVFSSLAMAKAFGTNVRTGASSAKREHILGPMGFARCKP